MPLRTGPTIRGEMGRRPAGSPRIPLPRWRQRRANDRQGLRLRSRWRDAHGGQDDGQEPAGADAPTLRPGGTADVLIKDAHHGRNRAVRNLLATSDSWDRFPTYPESGSVRRHLMPAGYHQTCLVRDDNQLGSVTGAQLCQDSAHVRPSGRRADVDIGGDFVVR